jgi:hypothetical protein
MLSSYVYMQRTSILRTPLTPGRTVTHMPFLHHPHHHCRSRKRFHNWDTEAWIQGSELAGQAHYHLSHDSSSFCSGYFGDRIFLPRPVGLGPSYFMLPTVVGMTGMPDYWLRWRLLTLSLCWSWTAVLPILAFQVVRIAGVNNWHLATIFFKTLRISHYWNKYTFFLLIKNLFFAYLL